MPNMGGTIHGATAGTFARITTEPTRISITPTDRTMAGTTTIAPTVIITVRTPFRTADLASTLDGTDVSAVAG